MLTNGSSSATILKLASADHIMIARLKHSVLKWLLPVALRSAENGDFLVSVIVSSADKPTYLDRTLACLEQQILPAELWELIVADHGADPGVEEVFNLYARHHPTWRTASCREGEASTLNEALRIARGQFVVFLRDDCLAVPDLLARHALRQQNSGCVLVGSTHRSITTHLYMFGDMETAGATACPTCEVGAFKKPDWHLSDLVALEFQENPDYRSIHTYFEEQHAEVPHSWFYFHLENSSLPRHMIERVGEFDSFLDRLFPKFFEKEFAIRLQQEGVPFCFDHRAEVIHQSHPFPIRRTDEKSSNRAVSHILCRHSHLESDSAIPLLLNCRNEL